MRHGHSPSVLEAGTHSDAERPLSQAGRIEVRKSARLLLAGGAKPGLILTSPLKRALQTAQEVAALLKNPEVRVFEPLANILPGMDLARKALQAEWPGGELLLIGHMPQIGEAASFLAGSPLSFSTACFASFSVDGEGKSTLLFTGSPDDAPG